MQSGKFNVLLDQAFGSSGKGKMSAWLAHWFSASDVSSSNFPNAGHSFESDTGDRFVAKAIPTAAVLQKQFKDIHCWVSPGSGFSWERLVQEWMNAGRPRITIHDRASIVTGKHALLEREGKDATTHIASTMQGTASAMCEKILRKADVLLARNSEIEKEKAALDSGANMSEFREKIRVIEGLSFRGLSLRQMERGMWLHEGSQGYALSIDHGFQYPTCTSRNCTVQKAMDDMGVPPHMVGDVYLNLRTYPIRVGNVIDKETGEQLGYSGDFPADSEELTWEEIGKRAEMPPEEIEALAERERTTVTLRIRRVSTFSWQSLKDAVATNGATKLCVNFMQYIDWQANGLQGGKEALEKLPKRCRAFIDKTEDVAQIPVVLIGTGPRHNEIISLL